MAQTRKKTQRSPRAPSMGLPEAVSKALMIYERERLNAVSADAVAGDIGYKDASSGAAKSAIAALRAFGLLRSPKLGLLAVSDSVQDYQFNPDESEKYKIRREWLASPKVYEILLGRYQDSLPSEKALKYELIQMNFSERGAEDCMQNFIQSVDFAAYYQKEPTLQPASSEHIVVSDRAKVQVTSATQESASSPSDRIPIRLAGGRKAWLEIPSPFYETDKEIIINQVNLIIPDQKVEQSDDE